MTSINTEIRRIVLEQSRRANVGHIGSALSVADILAALYGGTLAGVGPDRDRFVLSKGHSVLALYAALHLTGQIDEAQLNGYCSDGTALGGHPEHAVEAIDFSTGSLGHGLSIGAGAALAARMQGSSRRVFVLLSDAELNEGSVWEALMFANQHRLGNLVAIIDVNGQQALGHTADVIDLEPLAHRLEAFGWDVDEADGHDVERLAALLDGFDPAADAPHAVIARTTFGSGVSYMESQISWHYLPMDDAQYEQALREVEANAVGRG